VKRKLTCVFTS